MAKRNAKGLWRYWGYFVLAVLVFAVVHRSFGPTIYLILSGLVVVYMLLQAPVWCGALNRPGGPKYCRNNSSGLLLGCNQVRQHKWQKLTGAWWMARWRDGTRGLWNGPAATLATISMVVAIIVGLVGIFRGNT